MHLSAPFIRRPIGTTLLAIGLLLLGAVCYRLLPVADLPSIDLPIIVVQASLPGASPQTIAATVAAPLQRRLGAIPGVTDMVSTSSQGQVQIELQFALNRNINAAADDVQAAINAAQADLPGDLPEAPSLFKINPSGFPILIVALTSKTLAPSKVYDVANNVIAQRIAQVEGVAQVGISGAEQPAIRVDVHPAALAQMGVGLDAVRQAIVAANNISPLGHFGGLDTRSSIASNGQLTTAAGYAAIPIKRADGTTVPLSDVAHVYEGTRDRLRGGSVDGKPAVLLFAKKTAGANVVATVARIKRLLPDLDRWIPNGIHVSIFSDRSTTIKASVNDLQFTLIASIVLVMLVVLAFLRRGTAMLAAGITVPLSLAGTAALMWLSGFSLDSLSLLALTISVGFVVDDAIVMIENVYRNLEHGMRPLRAAYAGAKQIGFTVLSISISLIAAFSPLVLMSGIPGLLLREFSLTLVYAIAVSALVSLTVTPMICSRLIRRGMKPRETRLDRLMEPVLDGLTRLYTRSLRPVINARWLMVGITFLALVCMIALFIHLPKSFIPEGDANLVIGEMHAPSDTSFYRTQALAKQVLKIIETDPAVRSVADSIGGSNGSGNNSARLYLSLAPSSQRHVTAQQVISRLQSKLARIRSVRVYMHAIAAIPTGVHNSGSRGSYAFSIWSPDLDVLNDWVPKVVARLRQIDAITDASSERDHASPQINLQIDRVAAARLHVSAVAIDNALNDAFSQRQISTMYEKNAQYKVVLGVPASQASELSDLQYIYVTSDDGQQVPLSAVTSSSMGTAPQTINDDGLFPSVSFSYNLAKGATTGTARAAIAQAIAEMHPPADLHLDQKSTDAGASTGNELLLILAALVSVYLVLGVLYESLLHPLTIISTLPSAGFGAVLALYLTDTALSLMPVIGIVLLIGIVKKNGIMLVDFAIEGQRKYGWAPEKAIFEAARHRFRPITMTTLAAVFGAVPLIAFTGPGSELREPLGVTIIGGLIVSQFLTIYTTPAIYLVMERLRERLLGPRRRDPAPAKMLR